MQKRYSILIWIMFGLVLIKIDAQELPPIQVYSPEEYNGENQNWAISQGANKTIYFANNKGLIEFNGARWQIYPSPNETIIRSVKVVGDRIYSGCYMEFGYWQKNNLGTLIYTSLSKELSIPLIEDEQFWNILQLDDWILFQSLDRLYIYNTTNKSFKTIESKTTITKSYFVNESIYFQRFNDGIYKIENGKDILVIDDPIAQQNVIVNLFYSNNNLLLQTQDNGFYKFQDEALIPWNVAANETLKNLSIYSSIQLKDGSFALGTISNGVIHFTENGELNFIINHANGLRNNTVLSLFEDFENNIWLGLDNGINCLNMNSPFKVYNDDAGELGTVYTSKISNGYLYLGTNQGLFCKLFNSHQKFTFVKGTQGQVWCLEIIDDTLFCGHNTGTFVIKDKVAKKIASVQGTWGIKLIPGHENLLLQGNYNGFNVLEKVNNTWTFKNKVQGFDISSRFFEFLNPNEVFVSHEYKGVFKIKLNDAYTQATNIVKDSIDKGLHSSLLKYNNELLYAYKEGVFKYDIRLNTFKKDTILSNIYVGENFISGKLVTNSQSNKLWSFSESGVSYISPGKLSAIPEITEIPIPSTLRYGVTSYESMLQLTDQKYLLGTSSGYIIIDLEQLTNPNYLISIHTITSSTLNAKANLLDIGQEGQFNNKENNIEFTFGVPSFNKFFNTEYQYQLQGMYNKWSNWSTASNALFKNLPHGEYAFNVRAKIGNTLTSNIASYSFRIDRPWYLSNVAILLYVLGIVLFSALMHNIYKAYYKRQREALLQKTQQELALKESENKQQLMSFNNDKLKQDIENKNRELAISTMSLIKKNEFLNTIKKELKTIDPSKNLNSVVKIIDKNLNNTDDWKFFQEAFNNADKDFLKKVKSKHDSLTPNDLRLCAYLRLNLSSKEIAPLLNISPRSVEVKRYRLRKKMNLPHEEGLTNYILTM